MPDLAPRTTWRVGDALPAGLAHLTCAHCGTTTCCVYHLIDGDWLCDWSWELCHQGLTRPTWKRGRGA